MAQYQVLLSLQSSFQAFPDYQGVCTVLNDRDGVLSSEDAHQLLLDMMGFCHVSRVAVGSVIALDGSGFQHLECNLVCSLSETEVLE